MTTRYAVILEATMAVINVADGPDGLSGQSRDGKLLIASQTAKVGDIYSPGAGTFTTPPPPPDPPATVDVVINVNTAGKEIVRQLLLGMRNAGLINSITVP
jgi:hypothetical protein